MAPQFIYTPETITAAVGDMVMFVFMQKNHTVTQSTFAEPCSKMEGGMDSGFMPNPEGKAGVTWNMTVPSADPLCKYIYNDMALQEANATLGFYCKQKTGTHCGLGMVFSINPSTTGDKTMADFKQLAIAKNGTNLQPGALQNVDPNAAAAPTTVTIAAGAGAAAATNTASGALASATVVAGSGQDGQGQACSCSCLCGMNSFPANAAVNNFGGFAGMIA